MHDTRFLYRLKGFGVLPKRDDMINVFSRGDDLLFGPRKLNNHLINISCVDDQIVQKVNG